MAAQQTTRTSPVRPAGQLMPSQRGGPSPRTRTISPNKPIRDSETESKKQTEPTFEQTLRGEDFNSSGSTQMTKRMRKAPDLTDEESDDEDNMFSSSVPEIDFLQESQNLDNILTLAGKKATRSVSTIDDNRLAQSRLAHATMYHEINNLPKTKAEIYNQLLDIRFEFGTLKEQYKKEHKALQKARVMFKLEKRKTKDGSQLEQKMKIELRELRQHRRWVVPGCRRVVVGCCWCFSDSVLFFLLSFVLFFLFFTHMEHTASFQLLAHREANIMLKTTLSEFENYKRTKELEILKLQQEAAHEKQELQESLLSEQQQAAQNFSRVSESRELAHSRAMEEKAEELAKQRAKLERHKIELEQNFLQKISAQKTGFGSEKTKLQEKLSAARNHLKDARAIAMSQKEKEMVNQHQKEIDQLKKMQAEALSKKDVIIARLKERHLLDNKDNKAYIGRLEKELRKANMRAEERVLKQMDDEYDYLAKIGVPEMDAF